MHILSIAEAIRENNSKFMWLLATIRSSKSQGQNVPSVQGRRPHQIRELAQKQRDSEHQDRHEVISRNKPVFHPYLSRSLTGYEYKKNQQHIITTKTRVKHCPVMSIAITPHVLVSQPRLPTRYANQTIMFFFEALGVSMSVSCGIPALRLQNSCITTGKPQHATATCSMCLCQVMLIVHTLQNDSWHFMTM